MDADGDFSGKRIIGLADSMFLSEADVSTGDFVLRTNGDEEGSWTLISYAGAEDLDLTTLIVLGRKITRIDADATGTDGITIKVNGGVSYDAALTARITITEEE